MDDLFFCGEGVFQSSVSHVALLICFPSHTYECIIKDGKIGQRQPVSPFPILLKHLTCQFLHYNFLVVACSLFLYLWRSEMNFRKQVFSFPDEYIIVNFHMVPDKHFFHFFSIVVDCLLKSCVGTSAFLSLGE